MALDRFCCCSLQKGGIVYGWIGIVGSVIHFISAFSVLGTYSSQMGHPAVKYVVESNFATQFTTALVCLITYVLLVIGAKTGNRYLLLPWLTFAVFSIIGLGILAFIGGPILMASGAGVPGSLLFFIGLILLGLQVYIFMCILTLFRELRAKDVQKDIPLPSLVVQHVVTHTFAPSANNLPAYIPAHTYASTTTPYPEPFPVTYPNAYDPSVVSNASKV